MTLRVFTSNRLEILADRLSEVLQTPLSSPFDEEVVVVQSRGMERWISLQLAKRHGICANYRFPFPNHFVHEIFRKVISDLPEQSPFDPKILTWKIMKLLPACLPMAGFESLRFYLGENGGDLKRLQLSERIADTFDQYLLFRPEIVFRWEKGDEKHWQASLWRELSKGHEKEHRAALGKAFFEAIKDPVIDIKGLPQRVFVFGISALPRFHMQVFAGISRFIEVNLFLMNPCREYWGDILSEWEIKRAASKSYGSDIALEALHLEKGNSLLASMGTLGRDFFDLLNEFDCEEMASFEDPGEESLLSCLQSDILNLRDRPQILDIKKMIASHDSSIQIHSCHSPMREMEILHDQLLHMFEEDPALIPGDILVMTPDIESYAPYIQAVFDLPADDPKRIPFTIADRSMKKESEIVETFMAILDLYGSRFGASEVLAILESPAVQRKFGLSASDLDLILKWIKDTGIRWGLDGPSRSQLGLPPFSENTWKAGLERLLLGYAMPGQDEKLFRGILPYDHLEGDETLVLGRFLEFTDQLFKHVTALGQPRTLDHWATVLTGHLDGFFLADENTEREMQILRRTIQEIGEIGDLSGFNKKVSIDAIKWYMGNAFNKEGFGFGFMSGGVTFCALLPMRSIPFKIICLVGMNGNAYPRSSQPVGFDLMARHPKPGDRSRRNDDRYLFLEALLSARKKFYISYLGQSIQDNSPTPPSVLVSELMDYIEQGFRVNGDTVLEQIVTTHRLQAFSPEYFKENMKLFSYSEENHQAAQCLSTSRQPPVPFISRGLSDPEEKWKTVDLDDLCRFFGHPTKFLLNRRLGIYLEEEVPILNERETFELKGLEKYQLEERLLERSFEGRKLKDFLPVLRASGQFPHGTVGECQFETLSRDIEHFVEKTSSFMKAPPLEPLELDLNVSVFKLTGRLHAIYPERMIRYRYARIRSKDHLRVWFHHLALNALSPGHYPRSSILVGLNPDRRQEPLWTAWEFVPVANSKEILEKLLEKYWSGLIRPLHFFPESSWEYAQYILREDKPDAYATIRAQRIWTGSNYSHGECEDPYYQFCFRYNDPIDMEFQRLAESVFEPLIKHQKKIDP